MKSEILVGLLTLCIGVVIGIYLPFGSGTVVQPGPEVAATHPPHPMTEVDKAKPVPEVTVTADPDAKGGYNIYLNTKNFKFTPEKVGTAAVANEGHAHVFVNNVKVGRLYGNWAYVADKAFQPGDNQLEVTLNANDHSEWSLDGKHIGDIITLQK